ncbi:MAG TPA: serine/threonine-protein kinase [Ktedonobacteraceae bacterium]|nr:serine/threonine-protein kinase [Ktedonobacteraceae bacterium]
MLDHSDLIISGRYRLLKSLRRGGMSEVFLAYDERTQQRVAIKLVMGYGSDWRKRLQSEVRILRKLSHQHILPLLDNGLAGRYYYLVMPYMERGNLRERLVGGKMTREEAGVILDQLAGALQYVHERGIVHRDIKASNVLLDTADATHVYLADFGLATIPEEGSDITQTGCLIGTPEYMAPELAYMSESASSDIYALGILLYQMLTGRLPFTGTAPLSIYWKHIREQPAPPSALIPEMPPAVEAVILRALDKDPQRRFPGAQAMALAYANALRTTEQAQELPAMTTRTLPSASVTLYKVGTGLGGAFPDDFWRNRAGKAIQKSILGLVALVLLGLPLTLGLIFAQNGARARLPLSMSAALASNVLPTTPTAQTIAGASSLARSSVGMSNHPMPKQRHISRTHSLHRHRRHKSGPR